MHCRLWLIVSNLAKMLSKTRSAIRTNDTSTVEQPVREQIPRMIAPNVIGEEENVGVGNMEEVTNKQILSKMTEVLQTVN
jgi:hypothetical protein